jgi:hypothetical protein
VTRRRANPIVSFRLRAGPAPRAVEFRTVAMCRGSEIVVVVVVVSVPFVFLAGGASALADSESETDDDARLRVVDPPKTDSVESFGEGKVGTGESGARIASTEAAVNRDDDDIVAPRP